MVFGTGHRMRGFVRAGMESKDGSVSPFFSGHNTVSLDAAAVMAEAYGGNTSRVPKYIGFVYGGGNIDLPDIAEDMGWLSLSELLADKRCNIQVSKFSRRPEVVVDNGDGEGGNGGAHVVFTAVTRSGDGATYAFDTNSQTEYCGKFGNGMTVYRAVLLGDSGKCDSDEYTVLAMVDFKRGGQYRQKPTDYELVVDWSVYFK